MKKSVIQQIYYRLCDTNQEVMTDEQLALNQATLTAYNEFVKVLSAQQMKLFQNYIDAYEIETVETSESVYQKGFKTGVLLGIECKE